jgi:uncharacterized protein (UPF0333 family)
MVRRIGLALLLLACSGVMAFAADFNGKWTAEFDTQIGVQKYTYEFHVDGATVTGKAINEHGEAAIQDGKIDGDTISFVEMFNFQGNDLRITYTGKINGDEIKFTRKVADFATEDLTAKRVK